MTEQQIDRDQLRAVAHHAEQANSAVYLAPRDLLALLDQAEARIKAVRDLHRPYGDTLTGLYVCTACDQPCPCPTTRALDGEA